MFDAAVNSHIDVSFTRSASVAAVHAWHQPASALQAPQPMSAELAQ